MRSITTNYDRLGLFATSRDNTSRSSRISAQLLGEFGDSKLGEKTYEDFQAACKRYKEKKG